MRNSTMGVWAWVSMNQIAEKIGNAEKTQRRKEKSGRNVELRKIQTVRKCGKRNSTTKIWAWVSMRQVAERIGKCGMEMGKKKGI